MNRLKQMILACLVAALVTGFLPGFASTVSACPSCKAANETDTRRPRAYMYSILFMLAMPATVFTGFGISFYRLSRQAQLAAEAAGQTLSGNPELLVGGEQADPLTADIADVESHGESDRV